MSQLIIHGSRPTENYAQIPNQVPDYLPIAGLARSIVNHLLAKPNDWNTSLKSLYSFYHLDSKNSVRTAVGELQKEGFLILESIRTGGRFSGCKWHMRLDRIMSYSSPRSGPRISVAQIPEDSIDNNTDPTNTDLNKTNSVPESPPLEISEPISLDLEQSFSKPETTSRLKARVAALMHQSTSNANQERIKQREHDEARFAQLQRHNQMLDASQHLGVTAPYAGLSPAQTVAQLCKEYIANPRPRLDEKSRKKLTAWLEQNGQLVRLIDCFKQAHQNQSKTAKYVVKILAT